MSDSSSGDCLEVGAVYGTTPPVNSRFIKRDKRKIRGLKVKEAAKVEHKQRIIKAQKQAGQIKSVAFEQSCLEQDELEFTSPSDTSSSVLTSSGEGPKKKDANKIFQRQRGYDRDYKHINNTSADSIESFMMSQQNYVTTPNRFMCLQPQKVTEEQDEEEPTSPTSVNTSTISPANKKLYRRSSGLPRRCPLERVEFYQTFSGLIKAGKNKSQDRDLLTRQLSSEQEIWRSKLNDLIWFELQAYLQARTLHEQDEFLINARTQFDVIITEILQFSVKLTVPDAECGEDNSCIACCVNKSSCSETSCQSLHSVLHSAQAIKDLVKQQKEALDQVEALLTRLESVERLYPNLNSIGKDHPKYTEKKFQDRLKTLYLWRNVTKDIAHKLKVVSCILYIDGIKDLGWPWNDYTWKPVSDDTNYCFGSGENDNLLSPDEDTVIEPASAQSPKGDGCGDAIQDYDSPGTPGSAHRPIATTSGATTPCSASALPHNASTPTQPMPLPHSTSLSSTMSRTSSVLSFSDLDEVSLYHYYVDHTLKKTGMRKMLHRLKSLMYPTLMCAHRALRKENSMDDHLYTGQSYTVDELPSVAPAYQPPELSSCGAKRRSFSDISSTNVELLMSSMSLPAFTPTFLFLARVMLDIVHECLRLRYDKHHVDDPSLLSIRQLIQECREVLDVAVYYRQYYQQMVSGIYQQQQLDAGLDKFEDDLCKMLEVYFEYVQSWMCMVQKLPKMAQTMKNALENEWKFTKRIIPYIRGGEVNAGKRFCLMATRLLSSTSEYLTSEADECVSHLDDSKIDPHSDEDEENEEGMNGEEHGREWNRESEEGEGSSSGVYKDGHGETAFHTSGSDHDMRYAVVHDSGGGGGVGDMDYTDGPDFQYSTKAARIRRNLTLSCRNIKTLFQDAKERTDKAVGFARMIKKDLEIGSLFEVNVDLPDLLKKLEETKHKQLLIAGHDECLMFIPSTLAQNDTVVIRQLLGLTCVQDDTYATHDPNSNVYLVIVQSEKSSIEDLWKGETCQITPTAEITIAQAGIEVNGLLLITAHYSDLGPQCSAFSHLMGNHVTQLRENVSRHQAIKEHLCELGIEAGHFQRHTLDVIKHVDDKLTVDDLLDLPDHEKIHIKKLYQEVLHQVYNFGFEYYREAPRLVPMSQQDEVYRLILDLGRAWMQYVQAKCDRGRGLRPRWATQGLDFLKFACHPNIVSMLSNEEFTSLKNDMNSCVVHIIGDTSTPTQQRGEIRVHSPDRLSLTPPMSRHASWIDSPHGSRRNMYRRRSSPAPPEYQQSMHHHHQNPQSPHHRASNCVSPLRASPRRMCKSQSSVELGEGTNGELTLNLHTSRHTTTVAMTRAELYRQEKLNSVQAIEERRHEMLLANKAIGHVVAGARVSTNVHHMNLKRVNFKWLRGTKIGEGRYGKVYTAVNNTTGELMAVKEIRVRQNDHQQVKDIAREIDIIESIKHPRLVKYHGVEVYREEMLIFMEYCEGGTIEEVARQGMSEAMVRVYTKQLVQAVCVLHERGIVHRDIKGANIFVTENGIKLGDFGLSVRLKNTMQTQPGEVNSMAGTTAFMAPEVITARDQGSGRAADIWSVGCVVIEMNTGKRPWHEFVQNNTILYKVGMGSTPAIPEALSSEGKQFLLGCLKHNPAERYTAPQLIDHPFLKVSDGEDGAQS